MTRDLTRMELPIGFPVPNWKPPPLPSRKSLFGRWSDVIPLEPSRHAAPLFMELAAEPSGRLWTYLAYGPFATAEDYREWMDSQCQSADPLFFAICRKPDGRPVGVASYLRITPSNGTIEVGHILYSPALRRTPAATEAMFLMMQHAFELGYRRYEWKCDALNAASRAAAERLGFSFEGIFRQATVYKGRNRDTAWFAAIDQEWPALRAAFQKWLAPENFDDRGQQRTRLSDLTQPITPQPPQK